jgi:hypothetical protein
MARLMRMADESGSWGNEGGSARPSSARRNWASTAWLVAGTIVVAVTSYSLSLKVANERREMEKLARQNISLESDLKALDAELRVRMRMPQLQRWNDSVLGLVPISATQYLDSPVRLTSYGTPLAGELPQARLAVRDVMPAPTAAVAPRLVSAEVPPRAPAAAPAALARPAPEAAPADLLQQVEMTFSAPQGQNP